MDIRVGTGFDVHAFAADRPLMIGGVSIPYELGLLGHSDADVLLHAIADSLLGAAALGDIGMHFPDTNDAYKDADSMKLLSITYQKVKILGFFINNIDATVIAQAPKLSPYILKMRENISSSLGVDLAKINIKATTTEHLGFIGRKEGIAAQAVCTLILIAD